MARSLNGIHGVVGLIVAVGGNGEIVCLRGDTYEPERVRSPTERDLHAVCVLSPTEAWAVGDGVVLWFNGTRWYEVALAASNDRLLTVAGSEDGIWLGGEQRLILHRQGRPGGMHIACPHIVRSIACSGQDVWFLIDDAMALHADLNGCRLIDTTPIKHETLNAITVGGDDENLIVVGQSGAMFRQNGETWEEIDSNCFDDLLCVAAEGPDLWVGTSRGELRHSPDRGETWTTVCVNPFGAVRAVCVVDGVAIAAADGGAIFQHKPDDGVDEHAIE